MRNKNICKFTSAFSDALSVSCFVLESDRQVMESEQTLRMNRMILVLSGEGEFFFGGERVSFCTGTLVFGFSGESMRATVAQGCEYSYIDFVGSRADELLRRFHIQQNNRGFRGFDGVIPLWKESISRASESNVDLVAESILLYTLSRLSGDTHEGRDLLSQMIRISEQDFSDPDLSLLTLSEELCYNVKYLSHLFKEKMGMGYAEYLRTLRIKYAVSLFDHGIESVKNVALLSGFCDPLYFSTVFKKQLGISPTEYKKRRKLSGDLR